MRSWCFLANSFTALFSGDWNSFGQLGQPQLLASSLRKCSNSASNRANWSSLPSRSSQKSAKDFARSVFLPRCSLANWVYSCFQNLQLQRGNLVVLNVVSVTQLFQLLFGFGSGQNLLSLAAVQQILPPAQDRYKERYRTDGWMGCRESSAGDWLGTEHGPGSGQ